MLVLVGGAQATLDTRTAKSHSIVHHANGPLYSPGAQAWYSRSARRAHEHWRHVGLETNFMNILTANFFGGSARA
jgi:hypothetical protein